MQNTEKRIIEINGIKMEVDLRNAKVIENYKVGDSIKVLIKKYDNDFRSYLGVIIGFDNFEKNPTVVIAYITIDSYEEAKINFLYFNRHTKDTEITSLNDWDTPVTKTKVLNKFQAEEEKKQRELEDLQNKRELFEKLFGKYFEKKEFDADETLKTATL